MEWIVFALIAALASGVTGVLHRKVMLTEHPYAYAMLENLLIGILFLPILFVNPVFPTSLFGWILLTLSVILWMGVAVIGFSGYKYAEASIKPIVTQSKVVFATLFAFVILGEEITAAKIIGVVLIFIGLVMLKFKWSNKWGSFTDKGILLSLLSSFLTGLVVIVDKSALHFFSAESLTFFVYFLPGLFLLLFGKKYYPAAKQILKNRKEYLFAIVGLGGLMYYATFRAYELVDVSIVYPILRTGTLFTVLGGIIFLHERSGIKRKLVSVVISTVGVLLISGYL